MSSRNKNLNVSFNQEDLEYGASKLNLSGHKYFSESSRNEVKATAFLHKLYEKSLKVAEGLDLEVSYKLLIKIGSKE